MKGLHDDHYPLDSIPLSKREKIRKIRLDKQTIRKDPVKYWEVEMPPKKEPGNYKGKAILLVNHRTNSAANNAIAYAKSIPNSVIIGENSGSAYTFANVKYYALQHSRIKLWLPSVLILNPDNLMEKGFEPDYWLDSAQPSEEVRKWLSSPDSYQFRY
jgi:C-terminal processing protease CtpA/Prc